MLLKYKLNRVILKVQLIDSLEGKQILLHILTDYEEHTLMSLAQR